jgi:hypothetical protein
MSNDKTNKKFIVGTTRTTADIEMCSFANSFILNDQNKFYKDSSETLKDFKDLSTYY